MAVAISSVTSHSSGDQFKKVGTLTFDSSHLAAGESISASAFGLTRFEDIVINDSTGYTFTPSIDAGGATAKVLVYYADYSTGTDGALIAVPDATNLSTLAVTITAYGR